MKKRKKILSLLLCAVTCASMTGSTVSAAEFDETIAMAADNSDELDFSADSSNFEEDTDAAANDAEVSEIAKTFNDAKSKDTTISTQESENISSDNDSIDSVNNASVPSDGSATFDDGDFDDDSNDDFDDDSDYDFDDDDDYFDDDENLDHLNRDDAEGNIDSNIHWNYSNGILTFSGQGAIPSKDSYEYNNNYVTSIVIENGITSLPANLFSKLKSSRVITSVTLPISVNNIGYNVFNKFYSLTSVSYPGTDQQWNSIDIQASNFFLLTSKPQTSGKCGKSANWNYSNGVLTISGSGAVDDYDYPHHLKDIDDPDFDDPAQIVAAQPWAPFASKITTVNVENGIISLGTNTFADCYIALKTVILADSVESIGDHCFDWISLSQITMSSNIHSIGSYAFRLRDYDVLQTVNYSGSADSWNNVLIGTNNEHLLNVFPQTKGQLSDNISYTLKDHILTLTGNGSLANTRLPFNRAFTELVISEGITIIPEEYFAPCSLEKITFPKSLTELQENAFYNHSYLKTIIYNGTEDEWNRVSVQKGNYDIFRVKPQTQGTITDGFSFTLKDGTLTIDGNGELPDSVTMDTDLWYAIRCHAETFKFNDNITAISGNFFTDSLKKVILGPNVKKIAGYTFYNCRSLTDIVITASVSEIGEYAFWGCQNLKATYAGTPEQWKIISIADGNELLQKSVTGKEVTIASGSCGPNLCWSIDTSGLLSIAGTGEMTSHPWTYNYSYSKVNIQSGCTSLCYDAFWGSGDSRTIFIPKTVTYIDEYALFSKGEPHVVNYEGTQKEWDKITKGQGNDFITLNCLADILQQKENTLKDLLNYLKTLQKDDYISGWNELQTAIKNAEAELNSNAFTAESLEKQLSELQAARDALTYKPHWSMNFKDNICEKTYGAAAFQIPLLTNAPATLITYKSSNPKVAVISSTGKITIKGTGVTNITATAATDSTHFKSSIVYTVYINPGNTTVSLTAKTMTYTGKAYNGLKITTKGSNGKRTYYYYTDAACKKPVTKANSGAAKTLNAAPVYAGTYYAKVRVDKNSNYYEAYSKTVKFTIKKATPVITAKSASKTVSYTKLKKAKQTFKLSATATGKNKITFRKTSGSKNITISKTGTVTVPAKTKKGTYIIKVKLTTKSSRNYNAAKAKTVTLKVVVK